jgi:hypothetical protein
VSVHTLALDSFVWTPAGPICADELRAGDSVLIVDRRGEPRATHAQAIEDVAAPATLRRLLTAAGDIVVVDDAVVGCHGAPMTARAVAERVVHGESVRLELLDPDRLPRAPAGDLSSAEIARACLSLLPRPVVRVPADRDLERPLARLLRAARVGHRRLDHGPWSAFKFEMPPTTESPRGHYGRRALALATLSAWSPGDPPVSRTVLHQEEARLRRTLLCCLAGAGIPTEVHWLPSHWPLEARVTAGSLPARWPYLPVGQTRTEIGRVIRAHLTDAADSWLITGLALARPPRC